MGLKGFSRFKLLIKALGLNGFKASGRGEEASPVIYARVHSHGWLYSAVPMQARLSLMEISHDVAIIIPPTPLSLKNPQGHAVLFAAGAPAVEPSTAC